MTTGTKGIPAYLLPFAERRDTLVGLIASTLARDIIEGHLKPGDELNSVELSRRFEASRSPIREALLLLEQEDLIEIPQRRRARVATRTLHEIREIYAIRATLYALVAELIVESAMDTQIHTLELKYQAMSAAMANNDLAAYFWANVAFHDQSAEVCGNRSLKRILDSLGLKTLQLRHLGLTQGTRMRDSCADHGRLVRAYQARDGRLASELIRSVVLAGLAAVEHSGWSGATDAMRLPKAG